MSALHTLTTTLAAEPATFIYLATGIFSFGWAKLTRSRRRRKSTMMLISQRRSRMAMDSLDLLQ